METLVPKTKEALLQVAQWQLGVIEYPKGSNRVKYNDWYYGKEVSGSAYPWCMVFVVWCFWEAGFRLHKTASCSQLTKRYKEAGQWVTDGYKPGDIAMFDFSGKRTKTEHCGIIIEVTDTHIVTIEGNTGNNNEANGGAVMRRIRKRNLVTGACRPLFNMT